MYVQMNRTVSYIYKSWSTGDAIKLKHYETFEAEGY